MVAEVNVGPTGMDWNGRSGFWTDWNVLDEVDEVKFGMTGIY